MSTTLAALLDAFRFPAAAAFGVWGAAPASQVRAL